MQVKFWGVRGSCAVSGPRWLRTGGNTSCVEVTHEGHRLVLDGGTGLRGLGDALGFSPERLTLLFSHVHWDHIQGVPFFTPLYHPGAHVTMAGACRSSGAIRDALDAQMRPPAFPVSLDTFGARLDFTDLVSEQPWETGPFRILPMDLHHPDGVYAFRIEAGGQSLVYATDVEHGPEGLDPRLLALAEGADLVIHDAQYTCAEYLGEAGPSHVGWGHSTLAQAVALARKAAVSRLALFHHDPNRSDTQVETLERWAQERFAKTFAACEGAQVLL